MVSLLAAKVSALGVIMLAVSFDAYKPNCSFMIVRGVVRFFATETHSLSELRSLRDMALSSCITNGYNTQGGSLRHEVI